jgi:arylsulfatase A-like enzyme
MVRALGYLGILGCISAWCLDEISAPERRPNVLLIIIDDLRPELGCYGVVDVRSPNIDRLAGQGLAFKRAYVQEAICVASRTSMLTGARPDATGIYGFGKKMVESTPHIVSLPRLMKTNGYRTISAGKVYNYGVSEDPGAFDEALKPLQKTWRGRGYHDSSTVLGEDGYGPSIEVGVGDEETYQDATIAKLVVERMPHLAKEPRPFLMCVGFHKPHLPFSAPKKYWDLYDRSALRLSHATKRDPSVPTIASTSWEELRAYSDIPKRGPLGEDQSRSLIHGYRACVSFMDAQIGKLLDGLQANGLADNTIVVLWGDHGFKLGEYGEWVKHTNSEFDTRVPLIVASPQHRKGDKARYTDALVEAVDIYPTIADLCGLSLPQHLEGTSFVPLLEDPARPWKTAAFSQYPRWEPNADQRVDVMGYSVRTNRFRYTEWIGVNTGKIHAKELYDHQNDGQEKVNVIDLADYQEFVDPLSAVLNGGRGWIAVRDDLMTSMRMEPARIVGTKGAGS